MFAASQEDSKQACYHGSDVCMGDARSGKLDDECRFSFELPYNVFHSFCIKCMSRSEMSPLAGNTKRTSRFVFSPIAGKRFVMLVSGMDDARASIH